MGLLDFIGEETKRIERQAVPEEFQGYFDPVWMQARPHVMAACRRCGALIYPTALDRHSRFHEEMAKAMDAVKESTED